MAKSTTTVLACLAVLLCVAAVAEAKWNRGIPYDDKFPEVKAHRQLLAAFAMGADPRASGVMGGTNCAGCTILVAIAEQLAVIHDQPVEEAMEWFCSSLPKPVEDLCDFFVESYGDAIINAIELEETPDRICQGLGICTNDVCNLFPPPSHETMERNKDLDLMAFVVPQDDAWHARLSGIIDWIDNFAEYHNPLFDTDHDKFSAWSTLRGSYWRGKDCDDIRDKMYPGRLATDYPSSIDHDCNGIFGKNENGTLWEDILCKDTPHFGQAILGDSAAAHFHIPVDWVNPMAMNELSFDGLLEILENEFDWPEMSATTGYTNQAWIGHPNGIVNSTYLNSVNNNRCTFRDFQNCGVNGARTGSMASNIMYSYARNQTLDHPAVVTYALIGNDVCNPHPGFSHMTTPEDFYDNVVTAMDYLDTQLPMGSHVILMGLADGLILYESMAERIYPIGELRQDVKYGDVYNYLNCLQISPCFGWTNWNEEIRNLTQKRADELTAQYIKVIENNSYEHFDMHFTTCPVRAINDIWVANGGESWQLIEAVDGFHPNQMSNALISAYMWEEMNERLPQLVQPINPNNEQIIKMFGDQGGYR